ncbi:MAG: ferritin family protein [Clostridia bacterium]|nr:ferritin family protein [Clostridia bacterium]MBQ8505943.1 ferritin family protein [Clostridia bacterium]
MVIRNERQALCVAVEMERRAIRIYERALMLAKSEEVRRGIEKMLGQEREHYRRFLEMKNATEPVEDEEQIITQALGAEVLFTGGVMELERAKALTTLKGLYTHAAQSEEEAVETYLDFASRCRDERVAETFRAIAAEESGHFGDLKETLREMKE